MDVEIFVLLGRGNPQGEYMQPSPDGDHIKMKGTTLVFSHQSILVLMRGKMEQNQDQSK